MKREQEALGPTPKRQKNSIPDPKETIQHALSLLNEIDDDPSALATVPYTQLQELFTKTQEFLFTRGHSITKFIPTDIWDLIIGFSLPEDLDKGLRILGELALVCTGWRTVTAQIFARIGFNAKTDSDFNLIRFPELTSLSLPAGSKISMRSLTTLTNLASLDLGANLRASFDLTKIPQLRDLYLGDNCSITLGYMPNLRKLHFDDRADPGFSSLSRLAQLMPNLIEFRPGNAFSDLSRLTLLTCLTRLELGRPKRSFSPTFPTLHLPNLKYLSVNKDCCQESIEIQTNVVHLDHTPEGGTTLSLFGMHRYTSTLTNLTHLSTDLSGNYPNEFYLHALPALTSLNLRDTYQSLNTLTQLKKLTLRAFNDISNLAQLTHLSFDNDGILPMLSKLTSLRNLRIHHVEAMHVVSTLTQLESLVLTNCRDIRDETIQPLVSLRCLHLKAPLGHSLTTKSLQNLHKLVEFQLIPVNQEITRYFRKSRRAVKLYDYPYLGTEYDF